MVSVSDFEGRDILSLYDMTREEIEFILDTAKKFEPVLESRRKHNLLQDKVLATLFFQPSTRTRLSHESAMHRLGGSVLGWTTEEVARAGGRTRESILDTAKMVENYADVIAIRHYEFGAPKLTAEYADVPVINCGEGGLGEHPTQGLLDLFTIRKWQGKMDGLTVLMAGTVQSRGNRSLMYGLSHFDDMDLVFFCPDDPSVRLQDIDKERLKKHDQPFRFVNSYDEIIKDADVIYLHWYAPENLKVEEKYVMNKTILDKGKKNLILMNMMPRNVPPNMEIPTDLDNTNQFKLFDEARNGVLVRMAVLSLLLGREL